MFSKSIRKNNNTNKKQSKPKKLTFVETQLSTETPKHRNTGGFYRSLLNAPKKTEQEKECGSFRTAAEIHNEQMFTSSTTTPLSTKEVKQKKCFERHPDPPKVYTPEETGYLTPLVRIVVGKNYNHYQPQQHPATMLTEEEYQKELQRQKEENLTKLPPSVCKQIKAFGDAAKRAKEIQQKQFIIVPDEDEEENTQPVVQSDEIRVTSMPNLFHGKLRMENELPEDKGVIFKEQRKEFREYVPEISSSVSIGEIPLTHRINGDPGICKKIPFFINSRHHYLQANVVIELFTNGKLINSCSHLVRQLLDDLESSIRFKLRSSTLVRAIESQGDIDRGISIEEALDNRLVYNSECFTDFPFERNPEHLSLRSNLASNSPFFVHPENETNEAI